MRVLVCGGRDFADASYVVNYLFRIDDMKPITRIIHGGATGADTHAQRAAELLRVPSSVFRAAWRKHGKAAGPMRNARMLIEGKPDIVVAFDGGRGTADMVQKALDAGVRVIKANSANPPPIY